MQLCDKLAAGRPAAHNDEREQRMHLRLTKQYKEG